MSRFSSWKRRRDEAGAVAILVALFFAFIALPIGAVSVDVARMYVELQRVQAAADAAATAGVTFMPDDFPKAKARAIEIAEDNGFPNSGASRVTVAVGAKPTQLKVTVSSTISNAFARTFGVPTSTMSRFAVADFNGPAPMGSPCNTYGNEPLGGSNRGTPSGSKLSKPPLAQCDSNPEFWSNIAGPNWPKGNGDQFMTRTCSGTVDGCTGSTNNEFDPRGYFYIIRVLPGAVGKTVNIELYDPAFVEVGDYCDVAPTPSGGVNLDAWNAYTRTDAINRYKIQGSGATNSMCTGDVMAGTVPTVTSFGLRGPTITNDPRTAPPITSCARQYPGYAKASVTAANIKGGGPTRTGATPNDNLTKVFRQWVPFCSFTPSAAGDWYLQVRTNVRLSTTTADGEGGYSNNQAVFDQAGDDPTVGGDGANRYAIRAYATGADVGSISVSAYERMPIYANAAGADTTFNLVRVVPAAASKTLVFTFFDVGEGANGGTMTVVPPADSNMGTTIDGCTGSGKTVGDLPGCKITGISSSGWNGKSQTITVPIPENYDCTATDPGGCWFQVRVNFGAGNPVNDSTTWTASVDGQPVRLIE